jgi:CheY-like chemotaxis protein
VVPDVCSSDAAPEAARARPVLIADDNENVRQVLADYVTLVLQREVLVGTNGLEALWIVKHQRPDLVLLDLTMPRLGGYETIRHIRKFDPGIRIVVITGDLSEETRREVGRLGVDLLVKPFDFKVLDALLERAP